MDKIKEPLVTFGVLTDVQYADCDDRPAAYDPSKVRFYRGSLSQVDQAFKHWNNSHLKVKFVLQLGDIIDGLNHSLGGSYTALQNTLEHFERHSSIPTFHTVGNHELYNFNRNELAQLFYESVMKINIPPEVFCPYKPQKENLELVAPILYYKFCPVKSLKCISLDCFDISVLGYDTHHPSYKEASAILTTMHGHNVFDDWDCNGTLEGLDVRFQQMNGAVGAEQMEWLDRELKESDELGQKVIVFGHVSLCPDSTDWSCLLWNYDEVMNIFHRYKCVVAYFSGHSHVTGYARDSHGISYIVFTGIVETPPETSAFSTVSVYEDRVEVNGHGLENSYILPFQMSNEESDSVVDNDLETTPTTVRVQV
ncbi:manganese-dependent ADP-ribose/CDP-alcohol diphosphatase-like isoform X2 [Stegodyphus dumicola]|nr:manganese-dependent ADP-ribose/CDP-alcohol diphosphatase-like isoform X2 [Stegodyphus dumicola]XP_035214888.1 manganese-dependent ADP-ribose/CDP-alcohol diphosphatase-like isoform X2 [Stegodyphus dumicola]